MRHWFGRKAHPDFYGLGWIGEEQAGGWQYHLADALGSVRQLADASGSITLAKGYEPYGEGLGSAGSGSTMYGYTGEQTMQVGWCICGRDTIPRRAGS